MTSSMCNAGFGDTGGALGSKKKKRSSLKRSLKRRDGRLNTKIPARSELMQIAKRNSATSPLLRLPGEIRAKIWAYALGGHRIQCQTRNAHLPLRSSAPTGRVEAEHTVSRGWIVPNFTLPRVCRQIYVESAPFIYTNNTFTFDLLLTIDAWIKRLTHGQRRLVASIDVPPQYMRMYRSNRRKRFFRTFPNLERVGVSSCWQYPDIDQLYGKQERAFIEAEICEKEGRQLWIDW